MQTAMNGAEYCAAQSTALRSILRPAALGARLSPGAQAGPHDCRPGGEQCDWAFPSGGGAAVPAEDERGVMRGIRL